MKKLIKLFTCLLIGLFLLQTLVFAQEESTTVSEEPSQTCTDSDGGKDYYVKGTISVNGIVERVDGCSDAIGPKGPALIEWYCDPSNQYGLEYSFEEYECPNGCKDGACVKEETNKHLLVVDDESPASDVVIITDVANFLKDMYGDLFLLKLNREVTKDMLDGRITLFVYKSQAVIIVGEQSPSDYVILANKISKYLEENKGIKAITKLSSEIKYDDLKKVFGTTPIACEMPICKDNQQPYFTGQYDNNGCKIYKCPEPEIACEICIGGIDTGNVDENGCRIYECPTSPCESYLDSDGCTVTKCEDTVTRDCPVEPMGKYVNLNEKFTLVEGQSAKVNDYGYMKITLTNWMCMGVCEEGVPCETSCAVMLQVEMPSKCEISEESNSDDCTTTGTEFSLNEGQSKDIFGARITYLEKEGKEGIFVVQKPTIIRGGVDIEISPTEQGIVYGDKAVYKVTVTDKHKVPECVDATEDRERCLMPLRSYTYFIDVRNLPFLKEYPKQITLGAGQSETFKLVISPYNLVRGEIETQTESKIVTTTGRVVQEYAIAKPVKKTIASPTITEEKPVEVTQAVIEEKPIEITPTVINLYRNYKFNVRAMQRNDPQNQDVAYAVLNIKPKTPPKPPPFPGEEVKIKLYRGWNLISLPGKLVKFEKIDLARKLIGFVYLKEEQRYVTLKEAERILGKEFREYLARNAFWVYSYQEFELKVRIDRALSYSDIKLKKGWNLVPITEDMLGGYLDDIKGDCKFEKLHLWDAKRQAWQKINEQYQFSGRLLNYGFLIKVKEDCRLGGSIVSLTPPPMPE